MKHFGSDLKGAWISDFGARIQGTIDLQIMPSHVMERNLMPFENDVFKGIVSRDFVVCFWVSFDRSHISTHQEWVLLLLKVRFRIEFFDFRVLAW
jgi:hypothetical protein